MASPTDSPGLLGARPNRRAMSDTLPSSALSPAYETSLPAAWKSTKTWHVALSCLHTLLEYRWLFGCVCVWRDGALVYYHYYYYYYFFRTTWVSWYQKDKTSPDLSEARDYGVLGCSGIRWTICKQSAPRCRQITTPTLHHSSFLLAGCSS